MNLYTFLSLSASICQNLIDTNYTKLLGVIWKQFILSDKKCLASINLNFEKEQRRSWEVKSKKQHN